RLHRASSEDRSIKTTARVVFDASLEVRGAVVYASLIEALALLPIFFLEGLTGAFFRPLAMSYALAVLVSLVIALVWTPAMGLLLLRNAPLERAGSPLVRWLQNGYGWLLARIIRTPRPAYATVGALMLGGILVVPGTSLQEEVRGSRLANRELLQIPGVRNAGSHIGQAFIADEVVGVNFGENWISSNPSADYDETVAKINEVV